MHSQDDALQHALKSANTKHIIVGVEQLASWDESVTVVPELRTVYAWVYAGPSSVQVDLSQHKNAKSLDAELSNSSRALLAHSQLKKLRKHLNPNDPLFFIYTSGTTGMPKAAKFAHLRFISVMIFSLYAELAHDDRVYITLPLYHSSGCCIGISNTIYVGGTLIIRRKFSASNFWKVKTRCC